MCTRKLDEMSGESPAALPASTTSSSTIPGQLRRSPPKRPAGRTKFHETRHPCSAACAAGAARGVGYARSACRGGADAGSGSERLTSAACLNFADSAWLLAVPPPATFRSASDVQRAVAQALEDFEGRDDAAAPLADVAEDAMSATSEPSATTDDDAVTSSSRNDDVDEETSPFELDVLSDMGWSLYYASLAEGLLMEPPASGASSENDDDVDDSCEIADVSLWSY